MIKALKILFKLFYTMPAVTILMWWLICVPYYQITIFNTRPGMATGTLCIISVSWGAFLHFTTNWLEKRKHKLKEKKNDENSN